MTLTITEIKDLALFAGLVLNDERSVSGDELEVEITVTDCPKGGVNDEGTKLHYKRIAYYDEYPEEGCVGLGPEIAPRT